MSVIAAYRPGTSALHRMPAGPKLLGMFVLLLGVAFLSRPWQLGMLAILVGLGFLVARIPAGPLWAQVRPLRFMLVVIAVAQWLLAGWQTALLVCGGLLVALCISALFTLTTRVTALLDVCQRGLQPLRRVGLDPDRVGLLLSMTIRCVPLLESIVGEVLDARKARGLGFSAIALAVPVVVRALRAADAMGEALIARGFDE